MYSLPDMSKWKGRVDVQEGEAGLRWHQVVRPLAASDNPVGATELLGFACDAGVSRNQGRAGAQQGPQAIRAMLGGLPVRPHRNIIDAGDVSCPSDNGIDSLEAAQAELSARLAQLLQQGLFPVTLGGGHEVAWGSFGGLASNLEAKPGKAPRIGIINFDAHFDLRREDRATSGTPFRQIAEDCQRRGWDFNYCCLGVSRFANSEALFQRAADLGVRFVLDDDMTLDRKPELIALLDDFIDDVDHVYFTFCLDVLPAAMAPGVSAPAARGVSMELVEPLLDHIARSGKVRLADIAELNPSFDIDNRTARVAARLVARLTDQVVAA